jgi:tetratricopeptide (TPR) repeat protein
MRSQVVTDLETLRTLPKRRMPEFIGEYQPGSRDDVKGKIWEWINTSNKPIFWLNGGPGIGKSTIIRHIVNDPNFKTTIATFFFFTRQITSYHRDIINAMANELVANVPRVLPAVAAAARAPHSSSCSLSDYFQRLILDPLSTVIRTETVLIIFDAFDECKDFAQFYDIFKALSIATSVSDGIPRVKTLITSRRETDIESSLRLTPVEDYYLPPADDAVIRGYFESALERVEGWPPGYPTGDQISRLVDHAGGWFIWASTICTFIAARRKGQPKQLLEMVLTASSRASYERRMTDLYSTALDVLFPKGMESDNFCKVFGAMFVIQEPLHAGTLDMLLGSKYPVESVTAGIRGLQTRASSHTTVTPLSNHFHSSLLEFVVDATRCGPEHLVRPKSAHEFVSRMCLVAMSAFFRSDGGNTTSVDNLPPHVRYAVDAWPLHASKSCRRNELISPAFSGVLAAFIKAGNFVRWAQFQRDLFSVTALQSDHVDAEHPLRGLVRLLKDQSARSLVRNQVTSLICMQETVLRIYGAEDKYQRSGDLSMLACLFRLLYEHQSSSPDIQSAISLYHEAESLARLESDLHGYWDIRSDLAHALWESYLQSGCREELDEAIAINRELLESELSLPLNTIRSGLGDQLHSRYELDGNKQDLDECISLVFGVFGTRPRDHPEFPSTLISLAWALQERRAEGDIDTSIVFLQDALKLQPDPAYGLRPMMLNNLANGYDYRSAGLGVNWQSDTESSISYHREALQLRPPGHPDRSMSLNNLADILLFRFKNVRSSSADLDRASRESELEQVIALGQEALDLRPDSHPDRWMSLDTLAAALLCRFELHEQEQDFNSALDYIEQTYTIAPPSQKPRILAKMSGMHATKIGMIVV